jgi:hypothetical protein
MSWGVTVLFLTAAVLLWLIGRDNSDDVIGLLEKITAVMLVVLLNRSVLLEGAALLIAFFLPRAHRSPS